MSLTERLLNLVEDEYPQRKSSDWKAGYTYALNEVKKIIEAEGAIKINTTAPRVKHLVQDAQKKQMLKDLAEHSTMVIATAYLYALHYNLYGIDVSKEWDTVIKQSQALEEAYNKGYYDAMNKKEEN